MQEMRPQKWRKRIEVENEGEGGEGRRPRKRRRTRKSRKIGRRSKRGWGEVGRPSIFNIGLNICVYKCDN